MTDFEEIKEIYDEIDKLISEEVDCDSPEFIAWYMRAERFLIKKYGDNGIEYTNFKEIRFSLFSITSRTRHSECVNACKDGLQICKDVFKHYLEEIQEKDNLDAKNIKEVEGKNFSKVFIVYGHDKELLNKVARLLEFQGIKPVILDEAVSRGKTIIELLEKFTDVEAAICLFTADDLGREKTEPVEMDHKRARQNVVFETGLLMGRLERSNLVIIADEDIELPSDIVGVRYLKKINWETPLLKEMNDIGYDIDMNILLQQ